MFRKKLPKKLVGARMAYIIGSIVGVIAFGGILSFALGGTTDKEIPEDTGTLGAALSAIIGPDWQTGTLAKVAARLGGVEADYYVRMNSPNGLVCNDVGPLSGLITRIEQNGNLGCAQQIPSGNTILRPILATIRDLDESCYGQVKVKNASGSTYSPSNSDPVDIYEGDTITTTPLCAMASLYFIDHSIVRLAPSTVLALRSAGTAGGSGSTDVTLTEGELWARVFKPITDDSYFNVSTDESSVGVRGTSLYVSRKKSGAIYETKIVTLDSGLDDPTGKVAQLSLSGSTGSLINLKLAQAVTIQKLIDKPANITNNNTKNSTQIYGAIPFIRISTLADIADFDALKTNVGNLPTIAMASEWLRTNDIWSGAIAMNAPHGISLSTPKVANEITRTEPTHPESTEICTTELTPPDATTIVNYIQRALRNGDTDGGILANGARVYTTVQSNDIIKESSECLESNIIARIDRYQQHSGDYKIKGLKTKSIGFRAKNGSEGLDIGDLVANGGKINEATSSWKIKLDAEFQTTSGEQNLINIGSGSSPSGYLRTYLSGGELHIRSGGLDSFIPVTLNTSNEVMLSKQGQNYTISVGNTQTSVTFTSNIEKLFIGNNMSNNRPWIGNIQNIQIIK